MVTDSPRLSIRTALFIGFGLTLGLWLWAGYDFVQRMSHVQREAAAINLRYLQAQGLLATVRPQVLNVSVNARTGLLDPEPSHRRDYRNRVRQTLQSVLDRLGNYVPVLDAESERERVDRLRAEIERFGQSVLDVLGDDRPADPNEARDSLARLVPRRELVIGVTDEVQALNRTEFVQEQAIIANAHHQMQTQVWKRLGLAMIASLGIAMWAGVYAGSLERRLRREREKDAQNARNLKRLSARLVGAQEQERRAIARELHDELGQVIEAIKVELTLAQRRLQTLGEWSLLTDAQTITQGALRTVRDLSHLLHPAVLDDLGLVAALEGYLRTFGQRHAVRTRFVQQGTAPRLTPEAEIAGYRIVQEALTNVARHAHATSCTVTVQQQISGGLLIVIQDDGSGFDPAAVESAGAVAGLGLIGIRERVEQLHGSLRIESARGRGTTVTVELPHSSEDPLQCEKADPHTVGPDVTTGNVVG